MRGGRGEGEGVLLGEDVTAVILSPQICSKVPGPILAPVWL